MATDPVCGMAVETGAGPHREHDGDTWWFCSTHCRDEFTATPDRFLHSEKPQLAVDRSSREVG